jgi:hypothetical protein
MNDSEFHLEFESAARVHQSSTINILHFINDCERRKSHLDRGYSSIFDYCIRRLKYSSSTAGRLIQAARCIREHPEVLQMLEEREVSVSSICQVAKILDADNKDSILERIKGASRRDVERIACDYRPPVALRDRMVPVRVATGDGIEIMMLTQFLASEEFAGIFDEVRNLMSGSGEMSYGDVALAVFREYRDRHSPIARQQRREARKGAASLHSHRWERDDAIDRTRYIPDEVRDAVFVRDGGQCTFTAPDGTRCRCRKGVEVDHINPFAKNGGHSLSNLRLLCGGHNRLAAEKSMGRHVMQPYWRHP